MKFTPKQFATAFVGALQEAGEANRAGVISRAAKVLRESGGINKLPQISETIENVWQEKTGAKKYLITSALPMTDAEKKKFVEKLKPTSQDYLEYIADSNLIAGVVIKENESRVLDLSFTKRVANLFT